MTQTVKEAMIKLGYSKEYTDKYHTLTTGGEAAIQVNGVTGNKFKPSKDIGQGDPASAPIYHWTRAIQQEDQRNKQDMEIQKSC